MPIESFDVTFITDQNTAVALYEQGGLDVAGGQPLPTEIVSRLRRDPELRAQAARGSQGCDKLCWFYHDQTAL